MGAKAPEIGARIVKVSGKLGGTSADDSSGDVMIVEFGA